MKLFALFIEPELDLPDVSPGINNNYKSKTLLKYFHKIITKVCELQVAALSKEDQTLT